MSNNLKIIKSKDRGFVDHGWLKSYHTFSFASYYNPEMMHYKGLRVINEDWIAPNQGFATHSHNDMEIITYVISGTLSHKDSMGNVKTLKAGQVQTMSAGSGITHSEYNDSDSEEVHLYQMWVIPSKKGITPRYNEWHPPKQLEDGKLYLIASPDGAEGSAVIEQDTKLFLAQLNAGSSVNLPLPNNYHGWLQVAQGQIKLNTGEVLKAGDAAAFTKIEQTITALDNAKLLYYILS